MRLLRPHLPLRRPQPSRRPVLLRPGLPLPARLHLPAELQLPGKPRREAVARPMAATPEPPDPRRAALEALLVARRSEFVAYLAWRTASRTAAEELFQQVALRALERAASLRDPAAARAWMYTLLRRALVDASQSPEVPMAEVPEQPAEVAPDPPHYCRCTVALLDGLKPAYRDALRSAVLEGVPLSTLAAAQGMSANLAGVRLHRARAALRRKLRAHRGADALSDCIDCACAEHRCGAV